MLTDTAIRKTKPGEKPVKLSDEKGLFLLVTPAGGKLWRMKYRFAGKEKLLALGTYPEVTLAQARERRDDARKLLAQGIDPSEARKEAKREKAAQSANSFEAVARDWHKMKSASWVKTTTDKALTHLETYLFPDLGHRPINDILPRELLVVLKKCEAHAPYTATRLREMAGQIFRFAIGHGRAERNAAADLTGLLKKPPVNHHPAITERKPFGVFLRDLDDSGMGPVTRAAVHFAMLTFTRSQEFRFAKWEEIDFDAAEWKVPAQRMKRGKDRQAHTVPLARQTLELLTELKRLTGDAPYLFPNAHGVDGVISENTVGVALNRLGYQGRQCAHGFRASARSLLSERGWSREALERQLDHAEQNAVVAAYARSEHLEERRKMMQAWADDIDAMRAGAEVLPFKRSA